MAYNNNYNNGYKKNYNNNGYNKSYNNNNQPYESNGFAGSVVSYPNRGPWGDNKYRGNCTGYIIYDYIKQFYVGDPAVSVNDQGELLGELFAGGLTGKHVADTLGLEKSVHLDLNPKYKDYRHMLNGGNNIPGGVYGNFNALRDVIPVGRKHFFLHPPYHTMVRYSGPEGMWGTEGEAHPDDLSNCATYEEFIKKLDFVHARVYSSLLSGGTMAILVGEGRLKVEGQKKSIYYSMQRDMAWFGNVEAHIIKMQHNEMSAKKRYANNNFVPIKHEHLLIFRKPHMYFVPVITAKHVAQDLRKTEVVTWRDLVQAALEEIGTQTANLNQIYEIVGQTLKAQNNANWQAKVRQTLQIYPDFVSVARGNWGLASKNRNRVSA
ncbi:DNA methylase N-4/N-6 [Niallia taxi]|uniref:DNA methylase N-4/N-6 n=1 Tax=Niallia taxi TaxID=2499688 RepID=UPI0015F63E83|nr:DNA methylase N-4/N-6 [Niallia taxi]